MKNLRIRHPELGLIIKAEVTEQGQITSVNLGLPQKASKLEKFLLKMAEIYSYEVIRNNMHNVIVESDEYKKLVRKQEVI